MSKLENNYKNLLKAIKNGMKVDYFEDSVFSNFVDNLYEDLENKQYFEFELFISGIENHINNVNVNVEDILSDISKDLEELKQEIYELFEASKETHYLICPMQKSKLDEDIILENITLLQKRNNEDEYIKKISEVTNISKEKTEEMLNHTIKSRSSDFLNDNVLIFRIVHQTSIVKSEAYSIMEDIFDFIKVLYYSKEDKVKTTGEQSINDILKNAGVRGAYWNEKNRFVSIHANDDWRSGNSTSNFTNLSIPHDINFLKEENSQDLLNNMINQFSRRGDELTYRFYNAVKLFNRALFYDGDKDISNLLLLTTGESLLTQEVNEKRLRLSAIISRIVTIDGKTSSEVARLISSFYHKRNDFVHGGSKIDEKDSKKNTALLRKAIAKLIVFYFDFQNILDKNTEEKPINQWKKHVNNIFEKVIFGNE